MVGKIRRSKARGGWAYVVGVVHRFDATLMKLAKLFEQNFQEYADRCPQSVREAGPQVE